MSSIAENYQRVSHQIEDAALRCGRDPASITLIVVSKTRDVDSIRELYDLGHREFGESRLQEALPKIEVLPTDIVWHFIGTLQSNKARRVAQTFQTVHTLTGESQLREIARAESIINGFAEVNIAQEAQKSGLSVSSLDDAVKHILECEQVHFRGLMTIGPQECAPEERRGYFRAMKELNTRVGGEWLSMGMSGDFTVAIEEGATHVRVGTAIFAK